MAGDPRGEGSRAWGHVSPSCGREWPAADLSCLGAGRSSVGMGRPHLTSGGETGVRSSRGGPELLVQFGGIEDGIAPPKFTPTWNLV